MGESVAGFVPDQQMRTISSPAAIFSNFATEGLER